VTDAEVVVRAWIEDVWNAGALERLRDLHPTEFLNEGEPATVEQAAAWHRQMRTTYPDLRYRIDDLVTAGDRVAVRWTATGTQRGSLWGQVPPTGKRVTWRGMHLVTVRGGRIDEVWAVADTIAVLRQLGVELRFPS